MVNLVAVRTVLSRSRPYWFGAVLLGIAATLLAVGFTTKDAGAVVVAGFGFVGAGVTKLADVAQEHHRRAMEEDESRRRDRDETRRVSYMVLLCDRTDRYELAATVVNALVHHGLAVNREEATTHVLALVEPGGDPSGDSRRWLEQQVEQITDELGS